MGQCYSVDIKIKVLDDDAFIKATRLLVENAHIAEDCVEKFSDSSVMECVKFMLAGHFQGPIVTRNDGEGFVCYKNEFYATYSWSSLLWEWWDAIEPYIEHGSEMSVWEDESKWTRTK